ncbi:unnamed protein product [Rotaria socialis]|uniref:poly(A)-specific ribonuclease n=1 Tax=Rotaria socialis TaxID=392032 RepID=A0A817RDA2_9BILA|nr:unnamed protein product [Rotaria socialis]CAF3453379.1 unnamed protein product [Rotaria socialis]CAF4250418.1 unnamed protein product [Rotaria socialis]CAF4454764.1 unnamed protein product [Rotaria socialis]
MRSIAEPRRAIVSCKHIFSSYASDCSTLTSSYRSTKRRLNGNISNAKVFQISFDDERKFLVNNDKLLRTSLDPLSPSFYSHHHEETMPSDIRYQSETSDYGSCSTDPEQQFSPILFNNDNQSSFSFSIINNNNNRRSKSSSSSSSSSLSSYESNHKIICSCGKENFQTRKRYKRYMRKTSYESYQTKRIKTNYRSKYRKQNFNNSLIKFSIDLTAIQPPPTRSWLRLSSPNTTQPTAIFTVMNYNILCDKYATRHVYGYCPSWALKWDYRRKQILEELRSYSADIIALQEIETDQFYSFFLPELQKNGYDGVFSPKSRAKTMCEQDRRYVDGCAIFYRQSKFRLIKEYLVEFNQLAMLAANGTSCHDMMNRVMTKDNIGLVAFLETKEEIYSHTFSNGVLPSDHRQMLFVCTAHIHWDPEYCDVKVVQTFMLLSELKSIMDDAIQKHRPNLNTSVDCATVPLVLCGDFNSLPDSGVIELMRTGKISMNHADFKDLCYDSYLKKYCRLDEDLTPSNDIIHHFKLQSAYETTATSPIMPYTNYTYDFKGIIDYVFYSTQLMRVLGVLGPLDPEWLQTNKIVGCPHPNVPSDHFSLLVEFELNPTSNENLKNSTISISTRRQ